MRKLPILYYLSALIFISQVLCIDQFPQKLSGDRDYDYSQDAKKLRDAIQGLGTDEGTIVNILTNRTNMERQKIARFYHQQFDRELIKDLSGDLSGTLKKVVKALMMDPAEYLAKTLHDCMNRLLRDDKCLVSILCTKTRYELNPILEKYHYLFNKTLLSDLEATTDGGFKIFMQTLLTPKMRDIGHVNSSLAAEHIKLVPYKNDDCEASKNIRFTEIMAKESFEQIRLICFEYERKHNSSIEEAIATFCSERSLVDGYITILKFAKSSARYYAEVINKAAIGLGTSDDTLIRTIVSRQEIDLNEIKQMYKNIYHTSLSSAVASETSGYYKKSLLALIGQE